MKHIKVGYKAEPKFTAKELRQLAVLQEAFSPSAIRFTASNVVRVGTSLFLADIL
jgi:hypothetical protein